MWVRRWHPTPVFLPGKSHGWRSLVGCSPWGQEELGTTERLHFPFSLSCIGEGNGNPLQCSCLGNPRAGGAWWAAVSVVTQSRTRLKQLSSSSMWVQRCHTHSPWAVISSVASQALSSVPELGALKSVWPFSHISFIIHSSTQHILLMTSLWSETKLGMFCLFS